jgi:hypothetical protein
MYVCQVDMSAETGESFSQLQQQHMEVPVSMAGLVCQLVSRYIDNVSLCAAAVVTLNNIWTSVFCKSSLCDGTRCRMPSFYTPSLSSISLLH